MKKHTSPLLQESMFTCVLGILSDFLITLSKWANTAAKVNVAVMKDRVVFSKPHFYLVLWWTPDKRFFPVFPHTDTLCFLIMNHTSFHFLKEIHKQRSCARIIWSTLCVCVCLYPFFPFKHFKHIELNTLMLVFHLLKYVFSSYIIIIII